MRARCRKAVDGSVVHLGQLGDGGEGAQGIAQGLLERVREGASLWSHSVKRRCISMPSCPRSRRPAPRRDPRPSRRLSWRATTSRLHTECDLAEELLCVAERA
eukprot:4736661-Prymnesium_polylepis.2